VLKGLGTVSIKARAATKNTQEPPWVAGKILCGDCYSCAVVVN